MNLQNIRLGFANNSSSTHSMIFKRPEDKFRDFNSSSYFGWSNFTLSSEKSKREYLAAILLSHFSRVIGVENAIDIVEKWLDISLKDSKYFKENERCYGDIVDHQSNPELPSNWDGKGVDKKFFYEYKDFILRDNLVILGGNDNDPAPHPKLKRGDYIPFILPLFYDRYRANVVARKDPQGYWALFDRLSGDKLRVFLDNDKHDNIEKSFAPELVDLKITDFCDKKCGFCYQESTIEGKHAKFHHISAIIDILTRLKVFELAIGGGEPTSHPDFISILEYCKWNNIVPNFTTKSLKWIGDTSFREKVVENAGSFAFSVTSTQDLIRFAEYIKNFNWGTINPAVQIVMGLVDEKIFKDILTLCHFYNLPITLLGYKTSGRGKQFKQSFKLYEFNWVKAIKNVFKQGHYVSIGVDTVLVNQSKQEMNSQGIEDLFYTSQEGKFSCYIDGVAGKIAAFSYSKQLIDFDFEYSYIDESVSKFIEIYSGF